MDARVGRRHNGFFAEQFPPKRSRRIAIQILVLFCHPTRDSFQGSILAVLEAQLVRDGHSVRILDLYAGGFEPVLDLEGWRAHRRGEPHHTDDLRPHLEALSQAEGLILVYPSWWYGLPAMLKGWFDRVWQPGAAFELEGGEFQAHFLTHLNRFAAITTYGSPRLFIEQVVGDPGRRQLIRGLGLQFAKDAKFCWAPIYNVDAKPDLRLARERANAIDKVASLFS